MHVSRFAPALLVFLACCPFITASPADSSIERLRDVATRATSSDEAQAKGAIAELRAAGPAGLAALLNVNADAVRRHREAPAASARHDDPTWQRIADAIDAVAAQKDAYASGLYWYTDMDAAERAARASGKPILSLRLLGTLDSEFSCANSRFFRTALYANREVQQAMRGGFVLHWKSVRPVPKITIDFGDGRVVERTITGNSIHYVLDAQGRVIDAIPGLYGPKAFAQKLSEASRAEAAARVLPEGDRVAFLRKWHAERDRLILAQWRSDLIQSGALPEPLTPLVIENVSMNVAVAAYAKPALSGPIQLSSSMVALTPQAPPTAIAAARLTTSKTGVEQPLVMAVTVPAIPFPSPLPSGTRPLLAIQPEVKTLEKATDDAAWEKIAFLHAGEARLDAGSTALIALKNPDAAKANDRTASKFVVEAPLVRMVRNFERSIALDTVHNEYTFHRQIHGWLGSGPGTAESLVADDLDRLNERVYAELFLTPSSDPWLGLVPPDTYSALPNDGVCRK